MLGNSESSRQCGFGPLQRTGNFQIKAACLIFHGDHNFDELEYIAGQERAYF